MNLVENGKHEFYSEFSDGSSKKTGNLIVLDLVGSCYQLPIEIQNQES